MSPVEPLARAPTLATVSGIVTTTPEMIEWVDAHLPAIGLITTKSVQLEPNPGYREPVILEWRPGDFGNAVGLRNPGVATFVAELTALRGRVELRCPIAVSIAGDGPQSVAALGLAVAPVADLIEVNLSCPHAAGGYGQELGGDPTVAYRVVAALAAALRERFDAAPPILAKLSPNVAQLGAVAAACVEAGAAGLAAVNTVGPRTYHHAGANASILHNPRGGLGGMSGAWIHDRALQAVAAIRAAVGPRPLVVGIGGVSLPEEVAAMYAAGANVVGIGSAFGRVAQGSWRRWTANLAAGLDGAPVERAPRRHTTRSLLRPAAGMAYTPLTVAALRRLSDDLVEIEFDAAYRSEVGQFVFVWLPRVGERPFNLAWNDPATVLVRERDALTRALAALGVGGRAFVRGPYGVGWQPPRYRRWLLLAHGRGAAVMPPAAARLAHLGGGIRPRQEVRIGTRDRSAPILRSVFARLPGVTEQQSAEIEHDAQFVATVFDTIAAATTDTPRRGPDDTIGMLFAGPEPLQRAIDDAIVERAPWIDLYVAVERVRLCGVGICGLCSVGGKLTCQRGTIFRSKDVPYVRSARSSA